MKHQENKKSTIEEHFKVYKSDKKAKEESSIKKHTPQKTPPKKETDVKKHKEPKKAEPEKKHEAKKKNTWMLPVSFALAFLFFIPFGALIGLVLGVLSYKNSKKKVWPIVAMILNLFLGFINYIWTSVVIDVFIFGNG